MTKALIIGGGIAGPITAMALQRAGISATVHEAYDRTADGVGAFLSLATNGLDVLHTLDLLDAVRHTGFATPRMEILMDGRRLAEIEHGGALADGTVAHTVRRAGLYAALREEALRRGIAIEYGKRLAAAETGPDRTVLARFDDGTEATGDLLIGADGLHSVTRTLIDPAAPRPRYLGMLNTGGYARGVRVDGEVGVMRMAFGRRCFFCWIPMPDGDVWWFANPPADRDPGRTVTSPRVWRDELTALFAGDDFPAAELIAASDEIASPWATYDLPKVPTWHRDRMIIVGDAAHAVSPSSGQGASMAMEDAITLAKCLRDVPDVPAAFAAYEALRRPRVERVVAQGRRNGSGKTVGRIGRLLLPLVFRLFAGKPGAQSWMYDHRVDWATPVTPVAA